MNVTFGTLKQEEKLQNSVESDSDVTKNAEYKEIKSQRR